MVVLALLFVVAGNVSANDSAKSLPSTQPPKQVPEIIELVGRNAPTGTIECLADKDWNGVDVVLRVTRGGKTWTPLLRNIAGASLLLQNRLPEAERSFRQALVLDAGFWRARRNLAITLWHEHRAAEAMAALKAALQEQPQDALGDLYYGQVLFARQDCSGAVKAFTQAGDELAHAPVAALMASVCGVQAGDAQAAQEFFSKLGLKPVLPPQALFAFAVQVAHAHDYHLAEAALERVPADFPNVYVHAYDLALAAYQNGDDHCAAKALQELAASGHGKAESFDLLGNALEEEGIRGKSPGLVKQAYEAYRRGIFQDPHELNNYLDIARLALKLRNYKLGEQLLTQGLEENPGACRLLLERGIAYAFSSQSDLARADFIAAQKLAPDNPLPYMAAGILGIQDGKYDVAATALNLGVERAHPPNAWLDYLLARALYKEGRQNPQDETRLRSALLEAVQLNPQFSEAYGLAGQVWLKGGDAHRAIVFLEAAHRLDPKSSHYVYELAMARRIEGDSSGAAREFAAFRELEAKNNPSRTRKYFIQIFVNQPPSVEGQRLVSNANP